MKKIFLVLIIVINCMFLDIAGNLWAKTEKIIVNSNEIELQFENIHISSMKFHKKKDFRIEYNDDSEIKIDKKGNIISISAPDEQKVKIYLPQKKNFIYRVKEEGVCYFNTDKLRLELSDGGFIEYKDKKLIIKDVDGKEKVEISSEGIFVEDEEEKVEVSSAGIKILKENENEEYTNFWGKLLGLTIKGIVSNSVAIAIKNPANFAKEIINENTLDIKGTNMFNFNFGNSDNSGINFNFNNKKSEKSVHLTYQGKSDLTLNVENINGRIEITSWNQDYVDVLADIYSEKGKEEIEKVEISVVGSKREDICNVTTKYLEKKVKAGVNYTIKIPKTAFVGKIHTSNGKILVEDTKGNIAATTSNGKIIIENIQGNIIANTSNGKIILTDIRGIVEANSSNGKIELYDVDVINMVSTSNGSITAEISDIQSDGIITTSNGSIKVMLDSGLDLHLTASTSNSSIEIEDLDFTINSKRKNYFDGIIGKGGKNLKLNTSNGSIKINSLQKLY